ncbi:polysaccharide deacetylase family protein [Candidatus Saccharibacteria bacterium]|nr:polysaccharide deacetylase family protein [Candidatus Saccharibacteria bacterium]
MSHRKIRPYIVILLGLVVALLSLELLWILTPKFRYFGFLWERKVEYMDEYEVQNGEVCFGTFINCEPIEFSVDGNVNTEELGEYGLTYTVQYGDKMVEREVIVKVVDETPPELELTEFEDVDENEARVSVCPNGKIPWIRMSAKDIHDGDLTEDIKMELDGRELVRISVSDSSGNVAERIVKGVVEDKIAPVVTINGSEMITLVHGSSYEDEGAVAEDNCDGTVEVAIDGKVDADTVVGEYTIKYKAQDEAGNESEKSRTVKVVNPEDGNKIVYLTFDDGPGEYTGKLLDVLARYGVKATFFVTGRGDDNLIKREYDEGHTVALHTYSHDYAYVYSSVGNYFEDLYAIRDRVQRITGYTPTLIRFPGGSSNTISARYNRGIMSALVGEVGRRGFDYADWNLSSGDAGAASTADQVYWNVISRLGEGRYVVLQHDIKGFSVDAVERIIQYGRANGYVFLPMTTGSFLAKHGVNN